MIMPPAAYIGGATKSSKSDQCLVAHTGHMLPCGLVRAFRLNHSSIFFVCSGEIRWDGGPGRGGGGLGASDILQVKHEPSPFRESPLAGGRPWTLPASESHFPWVCDRQRERPSGRLPSAALLPLGRIPQWELIFAAFANVSEIA
jgi:hypothetical protein